MSCMGGWCRNRDKCKHYEPKGVAIERLCETGDDDAYEPLIFSRAPGSWEAPMFAPEPPKQEQEALL